MAFDDIAKEAIFDMIKTPLPKEKFKSKKYNYTISFKNTKFSWYSSELNDIILSAVGANVDFLCTTRHGDFLKTYVLPSEIFNSIEEFAKTAIQNTKEEYRQTFEKYEINKKGMKRIEKDLLPGIAFEGVATAKDKKQYLTYDRFIYLGDKVLILVAIIPASSPRELFWEAKQIIDSIELSDKDANRIN